MNTKRRRFQFCFYLSLDFLLTALFAAVIWGFVAFCHANFYHPALKGTSRTMFQLLLDISAITLLAMSFAVLAVIIINAIGQRVPLLQKMAAPKAKTSVRLWTIAHLSIILLPSSFPACDYWLLHTTFRP